ncbi:MAG: peptide chain release factor N(5)-glutamine methyltransferase [Eubacterium sp.]|nr:peptide chain release factor N(5)-glutamine methyltransferase [Eubacterium sp.]
MTYRELCQFATQQMSSAQIENASVDAWLLLEAVCQINRSFFLVHGDEHVPCEQEDAYLDLLKKRCTHIPLQYLIGEQEFMGIPFKVTPDVLIPRQDTESLVEEALKYLKPGQKVLDMCTGSGCIAISLKSFVPEAEVTAVDVSEGALAVAKENSEKNELPVTLIHSDLFCQVSDKYDMIVSNPPYIPSAVIATLMPEVRDHEPMQALDGTEDGLYFYEKITRDSILFLKEGGMLLYEIGHDQGQAVSEMMTAAGYVNVRVIQDLAGLDRVVVGRRKENV